jgi:peptidyl-prolyl cis-trans isomerase C
MLPLVDRSFYHAGLKGVVMVRLFSILFFSFITLSLAQDESNPVVLRAGENELALNEFNERFTFYTNQLAQEQGIPMTPEMAPLFNSLRPQYLNQLVTEYVLLDIGLRRGLKYDPDFVEERLAEIKANFPDEETYLQQIQQAGLSDATFRKLISEADLSTRTIDLLRQDITVKPYQLQLYYDARKAELASPAQSCAKHILVPTLEEAQAIRTEIENGKAFEELAIEKSQDPGIGANGGDLGCFPMGAMVPEFEQAAFNAPLNEITEPVQSQFGYHLILPYERQEAKTPTLDEVRDQIQEGAENDILRQLINDYKATIAVESFPDLVTIEEPTEDGGSE